MRRQQANKINLSFINPSFKINHIHCIFIISFFQATLASPIILLNHVIRKNIIHPWNEKIRTRNPFNNFHFYNYLFEKNNFFFVFNNSFNT